MVTIPLAELGDTSVQWWSKGQGQTERRRLKDNKAKNK
jgi:hypothetical protein